MTLPGLEFAPLRAHLERTRPGMTAGELTGRVLGGGKSNLTYLVTDGTSRWVLRRPPLWHVLDTAHDMRREYTVMRALHGSPVPVPAMVLLCEDPTVLGEPFYLMEYVPGTALRDPALLDDLGPDRLRALVLETVELLARLHAVDIAEVGLTGFGRPVGFNQRQVTRWRRQLDDSRSREVPGIDELHRRLAVAVPDGRDATVLHGDFRLDNVLVHRDRVRVVLDWEMSTLGDPLADVALMLLYAERPVVSDSGPPRPPVSVPGHPTVERMLAHYASVSGRDLSNLAWYRAFAAFKLAVILEGVHYRHLHGQTVGPGFDHVGAQVRPLVERGLALLA
ncbi:acyl-CoA dehydrogenase [Actinophytocola xinjiangensis]|uniref:Acyl-CoA dehydrogenase n=1 Tax=Actinophytocola xinjiangensis TaxID=485602 RepID=A0A7Z0WMA9_9PSEU|nr:phosphotransferase family protein [Actinophytocola xinjiangensis]OLF10210.1 acyl-CoA dehydrogenase [Actinophytocola xinjiangensis]